MSRFSLRDLYLKRISERDQRNINDILPTEQVTENSVLSFDGQSWIPQVIDIGPNILQDLAQSGLGRTGDTVILDSSSNEWNLGFNAPVKFYDSPGDLPTVGVRNGTLAFVTNASEQTKRLYVWKGTKPGVTQSGTWFEIMTTNNPPVISNRIVDGEVVESFDGLIFQVTPNVPLVVQLTAEDPEGLPIEWDFTVSDPQAFTVTNQNNGTFVISTTLLEPRSANITFKIIEVAEQGQNITSEFATFAIDVTTDIRNMPTLITTFVYDPQIDFSLSNQGIKRLYKKNNLFFVLNSIAPDADSNGIFDPNGNPIGYPTIPRLSVFSSDGTTITEVGRYPKTPDPNSPDFEQEKQDAINISNTIFRTNSGAAAFVPDMVVLNTHILFRVRDLSASAGSKIVSLDYTIDETGNLMFGELKDAYAPPTQRPQWPSINQPSMVVSPDETVMYLVSGTGPTGTTGTIGEGMILDISSPENISRLQTFNINGDSVDIYEHPNNDDVYIPRVRENNGRFYLSRYNKQSNTVVNFSTNLLISGSIGTKVYNDQVSGKTYAICYGSQTSVILLDDPLDPSYKDSEVSTRSIIASFPNPVGVSSILDITLDEDNAYMYMVGTNFFGSVTLGDIENLSEASITGEIINYNELVDPDIAVGVELFDEETAVIALDGALDRIGLVK